MPNAVLLLSGGLDSTTMLAYAIDAGFDVHAMTFRYGQRHAPRSTPRGASPATIACAITSSSTSTFAPSAARRSPSDIDVPKDRGEADIAQGIPITYVPARNTIFLSFASRGPRCSARRDIFIGVNALDYSGYPDCRPEYIEAFERMANLATRAGVEGTTPVRIHTPLLIERKREIVAARALARRRLRAHDELLRSHARRCSRAATATACQLRRKGFAEAGVTDPTRYAVAVG